jgi:hypothetical protein
MIRLNTFVSWCASRKSRRLLASFAAVFVLASCEVVGPYGSDGSAPQAVDESGTNPFQEPTCSGFAYYFYIGEGGIANSDGTVRYVPPGTGTDNQLNIVAAEVNRTEGDGLGAGIYFFMGGPTYTPSNLTAYQYGQQQANAALSDLEAVDGEFTLHFPFIMADIEMGATAKNGWYYPATGSQVTANQQVWQGFYSQLQGLGYNVGVYSDADNWNNGLGGISVSQVEWTYQPETRAITPCPAELTNGPGGDSATFFGGQSSSVNTAIMWQWSNQANNGIGDWDSLDLAHFNALF